ncbi:MAG TPA: tetratricopeptide repeat protein [Rhizomicrobium sp.]
MSDAFRNAVSLHESGRMAEAEAAYRVLLAAQPAHAGALHYFGILRAETGALQEAASLIGKSLAIDPGAPPAHLHLAGVLVALGRHDDALAHYAQALALKSDFAEGYFNRGSLLLALNRAGEALADFEKAAALAPASAPAHYYHGYSLMALGRLAEALTAFDRCLALKFDFVEAHSWRGLVLATLNRREEALGAFTSALVHRPDHLPALDARADLLFQFGRLEESLRDCDRALALDANKALAHNNRGNALTAMGRLEEALAAFTNALAINPAFAWALSNRALALRNISRFEEALADADKALALDPSLGAVAGERFYMSALLCDWRWRDAASADLALRVRAGQRISPWQVLIALDDPALQLQAARNFSGEVPKPAPKPAPRPVKSHERLRIAYLSPDFRDHPMAYLMVELFERHDRTRFESFGICLQPSPPSPIRARVRSAFEHFMEMGGRSDEEVVRLLDQAGIDIAIDLAGYTSNGRTGIFRRHPAPLTVSYIGYPGTMGAQSMDYILADARVIPPGAEAFFSEKVVRLPHCYYPADTTGQAQMPTRAQAGLPEKGFVFCCFNNSYKLTPQMFDIWMRLLLGVEDSVLWLFAERGAVRHNLQAEARARGVAAERLIFAERQPHDAHIARVGLADLFLDTVPCNAHTTASDALWAGVPLVTCMGQSFAARVAGSMLSAIGMDELITHDLGEYESLALDLALRPERLAAIRSKLAQNRATTPLFDMAALCRHIEAGYEAMWKRHLEGQPPQDISLPA